MNLAINVLTEKLVEAETALKMKENLKEEIVERLINTQLNINDIKDNVVKYKLEIDKLKVVMNKSSIGVSQSPYGGALGGQDIRSTLSADINQANTKTHERTA